MNRTVTPLGPWVLVNPHRPSNVTKGGLYVPEGNMEDRLGYCKGTVCATGPGKPKYVKGKGIVHEHSGLIPGDIAFFRGFIKDANKTNPYELNNDECLLHQDDILGIIEE